MQLAFLSPEASPIRRQYLALKRQHPDAILFFQLGDFYETFEEDARIVADVCEIVLTSREMGRGERLPMAGVPVQAVETHLARLVERGYRVAICQQMEAPAAAGARGASSVVRREVTRVITPGTIVDPGLLSAGKANYLAAVASDGRQMGVAFADLSTGEFTCAQLEQGEQGEGAQWELWRVEPSECLAVDEPSARAFVPPGTPITADPTLFFDPEGTLAAHFEVGTLAALGLGECTMAARAAAAIVRYVTRTHPPALAVLKNLRVYDPLGYMVLDPTTRDQLEIARTVRGHREGSLLSTLDRTRTAMGDRLLASWLGHPLLDTGAIEARLDAVAAFLGTDRSRAELQERLDKLPDVQRLASRAGQGLLSPREALALARGIELTDGARRALQQSGLDVLAPHRSRLEVPLDLVEEIRDTLADEPAAAFGEGVIRLGRVPELDELRAQSANGRQWLLDLERRERERTGLKNLKVGYNRVFGYYVEVTTASLNQPLDYYRRQETGAGTMGELLAHLGYQRRQTLATAERFVLAELRDYEGQQARSAVRMAELERKAFEFLQGRVAEQAPQVLRAAGALAELDVLSTFAEIAREHRYVRPDLVEEPVTEIVGGRHPVVERVIPWGAYIPNDASLARDEFRVPSSESRVQGSDTPSENLEPGTRNTEHGTRNPTPPSVMVLTGPNMAGKTTYGRMVLLVCLMAQCGCYVPAERARLGLVDRVFLRSGAMDDIARGQSTFMMEMTETAAILRNATPKSLAFFDEVGRGTSTYDGMAIARAIVEHLAEDQTHGCRAIFSTHYHELAAIEDEYPTVQSYRMEVQEAADHVAFTYRVARGRTDRSYGVHVARLAGLPRSVLVRAEEVLRQLESEGTKSQKSVSHPPSHPFPARGKGPELASPAPVPPSVVYDLAEMDLDRVTPIEALNALARLHEEARRHLEGLGDNRGG